MHVHHEKRLKFIQHPRTASNSVASALEKWGFQPVWGGEHMYYHPEVDHYDLICGSREHFSLMESWIQPHKDGWYTDFITPADVINATRMPIRLGWMTYHAALPMLKEAKYVIRFNHLEDDLKLLAYTEGFPTNTQLQTINTEWTKKRHEMVWSDGALTYVQGRFGEEMKWMKASRSCCQEGRCVDGETVGKGYNCAVKEIGNHNSSCTHLWDPEPDGGPG